MEYKTTNNSVYGCQYHVVFCPKYRRKVLQSGVDERFKELAPAALKDAFPAAEILQMEVMPDHVHLLLSLPPDVAPNRAVRAVKGRTARVLRKEFPRLATKLPTLWTNSYFVSTVGGAPLEAVERYIQNQKTSQRDKGKMG